MSDMKDGTVWASMVTMGKGSLAEKLAVMFRPDPDDWRLRGACVGLNPDHFIAGPVEHAPVMLKAREACLWCPVFKECSQAMKPGDEEYALMAGRIPDQQQGDFRENANDPGSKNSETPKDDPKPDPMTILNGKTHCRHGHSLLEGNARTSLEKRTGRYYVSCAECSRIACRRNRGKMAA